LRPTGWRWGLRGWCAVGRNTRHLLAACSGALAGHTAFGLVGHAETTTDRLFLLAICIFTLTLAVIASRKIAQPEPTDGCDIATDTSERIDARRAPS
jgi:hypothetical protein